MIRQPEWSKDAVIYEVNIRQYTKEGTFKAFRKHIPRLKNLGIKILWFMPIFPVGEVKRKGSLGSYYSIKDYTGVNIEFGTFQEFREIVEETHQAGMYVLLDWVANHTAWDNHLINEHPEWYVRDNENHIQSPFDWDDVADLDYSNEDLRHYMIDCMGFWVKETGIDGFRCDVADLVPDDFWNQAKDALMKEKHVFMLAESEHPAHHEQAFDMCYASRMHRLTNNVAEGKNHVWEIKELFDEMKKNFPSDAWFMQFISNHDENSWKGSEFERYGTAVDTYIHLMFTLQDMPLIYSGQETGMDKRLKFFDKDEINWQDSRYFELYKTLIKLKREHKALWNGKFGGEVQWISSNHEDKVLAFIRQKEEDKILVLLNFTSEKVNIILKEFAHKGKYTELYSGTKRTLKGYDSIVLDSFEYNLFLSDI